MHHNGTLKWHEFADGVKQVHEKRIGQPTQRKVIIDKPKEEDYFYANPHECLCEERNCDAFLGHHNSSQVQYELRGAIPNSISLYPLYQNFVGNQGS